MKAIFSCLIVMLMCIFTMVAPAHAGTVSAAEEGSVVVYHQPKKQNYTFTSVAVDNLKLLRQVVKEMGFSQHIETLQAIMMVETRAGTGGQIGLPNAAAERRSYGLMQLTVPTARVLFRDNDQLRQEYFGDRPLAKVSDKEIIKMLLTDARLNVRLGTTLFVLYLDMVNNEWARAVAGYNMGIGNALKRKDAPKAKYVADVRQWMPTITALNKEFDKPVDNPVIAIDNVDNNRQQKENYNGEGEESTQAEQRTVSEQSGEQSGRAEEIQNNVSDDHTLLAADR